MRDELPVIICHSRSSCCWSAYLFQLWARHQRRPHDPPGASGRTRKGCRSAASRTRRYSAAASTSSVCCCSPDSAGLSVGVALFMTINELAGGDIYVPIRVEGSGIHLGLGPRASRPAPSGARADWYRTLAHRRLLRRTPEGLTMKLRLAALVSLRRRGRRPRPAADGTVVRCRVDQDQPLRRTGRQQPRAARALRGRQRHADAARAARLPAHPGVRRRARVEGPRPLRRGGGDERQPVAGRRCWRCCGRCWPSASSCARTPKLARCRSTSCRSRGPTGGSGRR